MSGLEGKVAIVTGASSGIGAQVAKTLAAGGAKVMLAARRQDRLDELAAEIGANAKTHVTDVSNHQSVLDLGAATIAEFGKIDVLVNNAGLMPLSFFASRKVDEWDQMVDVNIKGVLYGIDAVLTHMLERGSGHIINVSSIAGHRTGPATGVYSGTKFAVRAISEGLRQETAGKIRVTIICPGAVTTELATTITDEAVLGGMGSQFNFEFLNPTAIADAIAYAVTQPASVAVNEILIRPLAQER
ncbi:MAG: SDR family oxidoreductase [Candidatus Phaeomarinobacter sp.]